MVSQKVKITNPTGLHLRPAGISAILQTNLSAGSHLSMRILLPTPRVY